MELSILLFMLLGWQFFAAEVVGAVLMVGGVRVLSRAFLSQRLVSDEKAQADRGLTGRMEGHAEMDMAVTEGPLLHVRASADRALQEERRPGAHQLARRVEGDRSPAGSTVELRPARARPFHPWSGRGC